MAAPWFRDILWRVTPVAAERFQLPTPGARSLYLTIDDGPTDRGTPALLEVLARYNTPATFFLVGDQCSRHPQRVRELAAEGHGLGNHTRSHVDPWRSKFTVVDHELSWTQATVEDLTGNRLHWVRPPHGHITNKLRRWCTEHNRPLAMWDLLPADFAPWSTPKAVCRFVSRHVRAGSIIVLHDNSLTTDRTPTALAKMLDLLHNSGWEFNSLLPPEIPVADSVAA